jgi:hypothetical protein
VAQGFTSWADIVDTPLDDDELKEVGLYVYNPYCS